MTTPDRAAAPAPLAERLYALMAKATPGPWQVSGNRSPLTSLHGRNQFHSIGPDNDAVAAVFYDVKTGQGFMDAKLIVETLNGLPTLLAALDGREAGWVEAIEAARRIVALHEMPRKRPTIEELERLLQQPNGPAVTINPDGSISADVSDALVVARALLRAPPARPQPAGEAT